MSNIRVTKEFKFEMAHALLNYDGLCKHIHGHSYILRVTIIGSPLTDIKDPKLGMIIDFGDLKRLVNKNVVNLFDHAFVINSQVKNQISRDTHEMFNNTIAVDYQPTCENLVADFASRIAPSLPKQAILHSLRLYETATSYAEWHASDNK